MMLVSGSNMFSYFLTVYDFKIISKTLDDVIYQASSHSKQSFNLNSYFYFKDKLCGGFLCSYLYIDIQMKSVVLDVFFLKNSYFS